MSSKRVIMIVLGLILVVTLACQCEEGPSPDLPDSHGGAPAGPTKTPRAGDVTTGPTLTPPPSSLYYTTTAGSYSIRQWYPFQGSQKKLAYTGQADKIEMVIWINTGEIYLNAYFSTPDGSTVANFSGSMWFDGETTDVSWDRCNSSSDWRASGKAVTHGRIDIFRLDDLTDDDVFIGGATCDFGDATDGATWSFDFTLYYQGEYKP